MNTDKAQSPLLHLCSSVFICGCFLFGILTFGCDRPPDAPEVVLYTSVDEPIAAPIVRDFEKQTGIHVTLVTDTEATKSVGLAERLRAEKANPQADVWWSNEIFHTINLASEGLLEGYDSRSGADIPPPYRDESHLWTGSGLRVRVIAKHGADTKRAASIVDLARAERSAMARPTSGTTGGHVAALYVLWGDKRADRFFRLLATSSASGNLKLLGGNGPVAEAVGCGQVEVGLTDNDDVTSAQREGGQLLAFLPDQDTTGTLVIPTTIGLVAHARHPAEAKRLIDFLLSKSVEQKLIDAKFAYGSVRSGVGPAVKGMDVDYRAVAKKLPEAVRRATAILEGRE